MQPAGENADLTDHGRRAERLVPPLTDRPAASRTTTESSAVAFMIVTSPVRSRSTTTGA